MSIESELNILWAKYLLIEQWQVEKTNQWIIDNEMSKASIDTLISKLKLTKIDR